MTDDTGTVVIVPDVVRRVVSLVPSLTETLAVSAPGLLVGATRYCTHPAELDVPRVGGTKNPDVEAVLSLHPDLVVANEEENRPADLTRLRAAGVAVWVTRPRSVPGAIASLTRMLAAAGLERPAWLGEAQRAWAPPQLAATSRGSRALVCIWRRPWMSLGRDTFAGDVLARLGYSHVYAAAAERYPRVDLAEARARDVEIVVLPDEPYPFSAQDGPETFASWDVPVALISGRHLTWYGPSLVAAPEVLRTGLTAALRPHSPGR